MTKRFSYADPPLARVRVIVPPWCRLMEHVANPKNQLPSFQQGPLPQLHMYGVL